MSSTSHLDKVKKLRELTGAGFKDCNIAINECKGDIEKSIEYLRIKGISKANKKMERTAKEGLVCIYDENGKTSILEINCETDFVAKNKEFLDFSEIISKICFEQKGDLSKLQKTKMKDGNTVEENVVSLISKIGEKITIGRSDFFEKDNCVNFSYIHTSVRKNIGKLGVIVSLGVKKPEKIQEFGHKLAMHIAASNPISIDQDDLDTKILEKEKKIISEELKNSGKNANIVDKILKGRLEKFKQENTLINQIWIIDPKKKVKDIMGEFGKENGLTIKNFVRYKIGE